MLWINGLLLVALLSGCTLARPEAADTAGGDTFCGFWLIYDRRENEEEHVFDVNSETEQMLLAYTGTLENELDEPVRQTKYSSSVGDVSHSVHLLNEEEEQYEIKGTIYLIDEEQSMRETDYNEVWLQGDVVQSFLDFYVQPPEGKSQDGMIQPGKNTIVYIPQEQIDRHGQELMQIAEKAGMQLILKSESPRQLKGIPVYQRADGTIYADESSMHCLMNDHSSTTHTMEHTQTINGKTNKKRFSVTISVNRIDALQTVRLVEMDAQNVMLRSTEATLEYIQSLAKQQKPFRAGKDCAYLIVEETYGTTQGESHVKRTVYSPANKDAYENLLHTFHFPKDNGLTEAAFMNIAF